MNLEGVCVAAESKCVLPPDPRQFVSNPRDCVLVGSSTHVTTENHVWASRVNSRSVSQELKCDLRIIDDHKGLPQYCDRADWAIKILML